MGIPPAIWANPAERKAMVAALNREFPRWSTFETDSGLIWSARKGPWKSPMTLTTDNPHQMWALLVLEHKDAA
jgi:hypothetical protein